MSDVAGSHTLDVPAARAVCIECLLDVESYPRWYRTLDAVSVLERDGEGRPAIVASVADAGPLGEVEFHLRQLYELPDAIQGEQVGGNGKVKNVSNAWTLEALAADATRVTYRFAADAGGFATRLALRAARPLAERDLVRGFAEALAREAGRRAGG